MTKRLLLTLGGLTLLVGLWMSSLALAQTTTTSTAVPAATATATRSLLTQPTARATAAAVGTPTTNVNYFFVVCDDRAVLDLDGIIGRNLDVYIQVFRNAGASGTPLTNEIRIQLDGTFQSSTLLQFNGTERVLLGQFASARLKIARETDVSRTTFETTVDDINDGCAEPQYTSTTITGSTATISGTPGAVVTDPTTGVARVVIGDSGIYKPDGTKLNPIYGAVQEQIVQIGARPSELQPIQGRTSNPGVIFAECNSFPLSRPGRLFDTDPLSVYWSWFAKTPEQVQDHINNAQYDVQIGNLGALRVIRSEITQLDDGNYWVFYTANLGDAWRPGGYQVVFRLSWANTISDGYDEYGPGTGANEFISSACDFTIEPNPFGIVVNYKNPNSPVAQP